MTDTKDSPNRDQRITLRVTDAERAAIEESAEAADRSVSAHIRQAATQSDSSRPRVPAINEEAWRELARAVANLNQIARAANQLRRRINESGVSAELADQGITILSPVVEMADELGERVQSLRRDLYGAAPLELAADVLDDFRQAANTDQVDRDADKLGAVSAYLRKLANSGGESTG